MLCIINGNIITMESENFEKGYIIIEDGKIKNTGDMKDIPEVSACCEVIDVEGAVITPGLIDAHSHIGIWEDGIDFEGADGNEDTDPITPQLRVIDGINPQDRAFSEAVRAGVTTVVVSPGSANPIGGSIVSMKTHGICVDDMIISDLTGVKAALGENPKWAYHEKDQTPATRMGTAAIIREALKKAKDYAEQLDKHSADPENENKPDWDAKYDALLPVIKGQVPMHFHAHRLDDIFTAIRIGKEFDIKIVLVHGTEAHLAAERIKQENVPVLSGPILTDRSKPELKNQTESAPCILTKAGIKTALICDHPETPQKFLMFCAAAAIREGLSNEDALASITRIPAEICGIADRVGSIKDGKDADIVIWDGNPPEVSAKARLVIMDGKIIKFD